MQSDLRRPERWRGRVRSPFAGWSVFVGVTVAIVFGVVFWSSVWLLLRPSESLGTVVTYDLVEEPEATEIVVDATKPLRYAERDGVYEQRYTDFNTSRSP